MTDWIATTRLPIADVAPNLGLLSRRRHYACPLHCSNDLPVYATADKWRCCRCDIRGDAPDLVAYSLHGKRLRECDDAERGAVRSWFAVPIPVVARVTDPVVDVPVADIEAWWDACLPLTGTCPASRFLASRSIDWSRLDGIARMTRPALAGVDWWPAGRGRTWRLVSRGWRDGAVCNMHGRAIGRIPFGQDGRPLKKALWAKGIPSGNALLWNGVPPEVGCVTIVAEGITDFLTFCAEKWQSPVTIYGATSGGFGRFPTPVGKPIVIAPDSGDVIPVGQTMGAGDKYECRIRAAMPEHRITRAQLPNGVDVNAYAMGGGDLRGLVAMALSG